MKIERMILIAFLGNYLVNNIAAGLASLVPGSQATTPLQQIFSAQYMTFAALAAITTGLMAWWYLKNMSHDGGMMQGLIFGAVGFVVAVATALITGIAGVLLQTGSLTEVTKVLPNFGPYLWQWTTLILLAVWVIPGVLVGMLMQRRMGGPAAQSSDMGDM